ncbi:hypothetical protein BO78DRAFT_199279 [Aspergillus sclerotiicarbonarius CBS 121057]|uniref:Uncharacterized protein n=1 Tax=Aspergillus sclerotiicarbonarius (strain CBS 121057 / IBT 28362) TaxID=1448318 RepID=A0A319EHU0_ASPSB|nr:hypothetical protein BO78DRAFT_199279 [Aspergillus sclerotiicarbonarius CBS 121057]
MSEQIGASHRRPPTDFPRTVRPSTRAQWVSPSPRRESMQGLEPNGAVLQLSLALPPNNTRQSPCRASHPGEMRSNPYPSFSPSPLPAREGAQARFFLRRGHPLPNATGLSGGMMKNKNGQGQCAKQWKSLLTRMLMCPGLGSEMENTDGTSVPQM